MTEGEWRAVPRVTPEKAKVLADHGFDQVWVAPIEWEARRGGDSIGSQTIESLTAGDLAQAIADHLPLT